MKLLNFITDKIYHVAYDMSDKFHIRNEIIMTVLWFLVIIIAIKLIKLIHKYVKNNFNKILDAIIIKFAIDVIYANVNNA
jgi:hypothetical protein